MVFGVCDQVWFKNSYISSCCYRGMPVELRGQVKAVSMTLNDFVEGVTTFEQKLDKVLGSKPKVQRDVVLSADGVVELRDERCLECGSVDIVHNGTNPKTLERGLKIVVQRYLCNSCDHDFTAPVEGYLKKTSIIETTP